MWLVWRLWSVAACLCACALAQLIAQEPVLSPRTARVRERPPVKMDEPTCEQLKAMWRFSKRQSRAPEIMNEVNSYRDPLMYNEWPVYTSIPRAAPRFRYQYPSVPREAYGRVITKAPPNVVRTPDFEMFGTLNAPHEAGKLLRYPGPSRSRSNPSFMVPPQRDRFETLKNMIQQEYRRERQRKYEAEQKQELKDIAAGRMEEYAYGAYPEPEPKNLLQDYTEDPVPRPQNKKPLGGSRQVSQFSRYSEMMVPPSRRTPPPPLHPYYDYDVTQLLPYAY